MSTPYIVKICVCLNCLKYMWALPIDSNDCSFSTVSAHMGFSEQHGRKRARHKHAQNLCFVIFLGMLYMSLRMRKPTVWGSDWV